MKRLHDKLANVNAHLSLLIHIKKNYLPISSRSASQHPHHPTLVILANICAGKGLSCEPRRGSAEAEIVKGKGIINPFTSLDLLGGCSPLPISWTAPKLSQPFTFQILFCCCHQIQVCSNAEKACAGFFPFPRREELHRSICISELQLCPGVSWSLLQHGVCGPQHWKMIYGIL